MSYFVSFTHGPGYLEVFLDMLSIILLSDLIAILLLIRICWKSRKKEGRVIHIDEHESVTETTSEQTAESSSIKVTAIKSETRRRRRKATNSKTSTNANTVASLHNQARNKSRRDGFSNSTEFEEKKALVDIGTNTEEFNVRQPGGFLVESEETSGHLGGGRWIRFSEENTIVTTEETTAHSEFTNISTNAAPKLDGIEISTQTEAPLVSHKETTTKTGYQEFLVNSPDTEEKKFAEIGTNTEEIKDERPEDTKAEFRDGGDLIIHDTRINITENTLIAASQETVVNSVTVRSDLPLDQRPEQVEISTQTDDSPEKDQQIEPETSAISTQTPREETKELVENWTSTEEEFTTHAVEGSDYDIDESQSDVKPHQSEISTQTIPPSVADKQIEYKYEPETSSASTQVEKDTKQVAEFGTSVVETDGSDKQVANKEETKEFLNVTETSLVARTEESTEYSTTVTTTNMRLEQLQETMEISTQTEEDEYRKEETEKDPETSSISVQTAAVQIQEHETQTEEPKKDETVTLVEAVLPRPPLRRGKSRDDITFLSGWRRTVKLTDLMEARLIMETRVQELEREEITEADVERELAPFLVGKYPIAGVIINETGQKMSLFNAYKKGIISRGTAISLLEAQAGVGSIIDPVDGAKMSVEEAKQRGLLDKSMAAVLSRAERAVTGFKPRATNETLSLFQAMQRELIVETHGIRLLEAQIATGGIIDPQANVRLPVEVAFERGLFDERLHRILEDPSDDTKGFLDPNTQENLTYLGLIQRCVVDGETELLLLPLVTQDEWQDYKERHSSSSSAGKSRTFSGRTTSSTGGSVGGLEDMH